MATEQGSAGEGGGLHVDVPGRASILLRHLVLDLNGTLALDGQVLPGVAQRLALLRDALHLHVLTAGTHGHLAETAATLGLQPLAIGTGLEKRSYVQSLGASSVVAMGNGANDVPMLEEAALAIAVLGPEGLCAGALRAADVVVAHPCDGLDLLLHPARLVATLRP